MNFILLSQTNYSPVRKSYIYKYYDPSSLHYLILISASALPSEIKCHQKVKAYERRREFFVGLSSTVQ